MARKSTYFSIAVRQVYFRKDKQKQHIKKHDQLLTDTANAPSTLLSLSSHLLTVTLILSSNHRHIKLLAKPKPVKTADESDSNFFFSQLQIVKSQQASKNVLIHIIAQAKQELEDTVKIAKSKNYQLK